MFLMYKMHKYHALFIIVCNLLCLRILSVWAEPKSELLQHNNDYDVTTIYRIRNVSALITRDFWNENVLSIKNDYDLIEIYSRTNSIGLPIEYYNEDTILKTNVKELFANGWFQTNEHTNLYYISPYMKNITVKSDGTICPAYEYNNRDISHFFKTKPNISGKYPSYVCYLALSCRETSFSGQTLLTVDWVPDKKQTCLTITYMYDNYENYMNSYIDLSISDENNNEITSITLNNVESPNKIQTLKITNMDLAKDNKYRLSITKHKPNNNNYNSQILQFDLIRIAQCANQDEEEFLMLSIGKYGRRIPEPFRIIGLPEKQPSEISLEIKPNLCLNGGRKQTALDSKCICPPGFKGELCETGCGPNLFGADCSGVCSMHSSIQCRGTLMCTSYGCTCPAGLNGPLCEDECKPGYYGANCEQKCSPTCFNNTCDQYTGICSKECITGYVPPNCQEKYPYLIEPPTQISNKYDSIEIQLNFHPDNRGGDKNMKLKYYQLIFKSKENQYTSTQFKSLSEYTCTEILNDLIPDTLYEVGVLVITNDGNFNDQDLVFGQYTTDCIQRQVNDFDIELTPGVKSVNVTWNKIITKKYECAILAYVLKLTLNRKNEYSGSEEITASSDNGHVIKDLIPGYRYNITVTAKTSRGPLQSSPGYSFAPFMPDDDVKIKDIVTTTENDKIKISWKLGSLAHPHDTLVEHPLTWDISYKLNRIFSCSPKEIENSNWTTIQIYNQTNYVIFDTVPNSQYGINVSVHNSAIQSGNMVYFYTPPSNPQTKPDIDKDHPIIVTKNSVNVQWNAYSINCRKLNGFLMSYYIELKDTISNILQIRETKQNNISFDNLNPNTSYEMKVFMKTYFGYNPEQFLFFDFTTKLENLRPVDDLMVYKKSMKSRTIGLRWSFSPADTNLNGFQVSFNENLTDDLVVPPIKCSAWPEYYCHTFNNLNFNKNYSKPYTVKISPLTLDYPNGGNVSSISFLASDGLPDTPVNVRAQFVDNTTITLQWDIPWVFNSVLKMFVINVEDISPSDFENNVNTVDNISPIEIQIFEELPTYSYSITDLKPGFTYSFGVLVVSKSLWYSAPARIAVTTLLENNK